MADGQNGSTNFQGPQSRDSRSRRTRKADGHKRACRLAVLGDPLPPGGAIIAGQGKSNLGSPRSLMSEAPSQRLKARSLLLGSLPPVFLAFPPILNTTNLFFRDHPTTPSSSFPDERTLSHDISFGQSWPLSCKFGSTINGSPRVAAAADAIIA